LENASFFASARGGTVPASQQVMSRIAVGTWRGRVSTTLDFAGSLLVADMAGGEVLARREASLGTAVPQLIAMRLEQMGAEVVICGAISRCLARNLELRGIRVIPLVSGAVEEVLQAFAEDRLTDGSFLMAGCRPDTRGVGRCRRRGGRPRGA
jgi:predicted Fe-Mo cluster-binding NifX family protein